MVTAAHLDDPMSGDRSSDRAARLSPPISVPDSLAAPGSRPRSPRRRRDRSVDPVHAVPHCSAGIASARRLRGIAGSMPTMLGASRAGSGSGALGRRNDPPLGGSHLSLGWSSTAVRTRPDRRHQLRARPPPQRRRLRHAAAFALRSPTKRGCHFPEHIARRVLDAVIDPAAVDRST